MSLHIPEGVKIDPAIVRYLDSSLEEREELKLKPLESKVQRLTDAEIEKVVQIRREASSQLKAHQRGEKIAIKPTSYLGASVTKEEAKQFQESLVRRNPLSNKLELGSLTKLLSFGSKEAKTEEQQVKPIVDYMSPMVGWKDELLPNGAVLFPGERSAIWLCTTDAYLLVNGTLSNDTTSLGMFVGTLLGLDCQADISQRFLKECQKEVPLIAKTAVSGMNKLPSFKGTLYRGDAMPKSQLEE